MTIAAIAIAYDVAEDVIEKLLENDQEE